MRTIKAVRAATPLGLRIGAPVVVLVVLLAAVVLLVLVRGAAGLADDLRVQVGRLRRLG